MAHAHATEGIKMAIRGGVKSIEHGTFIDQEGIDLAVKNNCFIVPTIYIGKYVVENFQVDGAQSKKC